MRNDQIFVLLLVVLLPMSGCFDAVVLERQKVLKILMRLQRNN